MKVLTVFSKRPSTGLVLKGIGAQQHFKNDCDLNAIIKKYPDGLLPQPQTMPQYGDFTALGKGLQASMNALQFVSDWFASLPSEIRAKFDNDPLKAQQFVLNDQAGAVKLGIISIKEAPKADGEAVIGAEKGAVVEPPTAATTTSPEGDKPKA